MGAQLPPLRCVSGAASWPQAGPKGCSPAPGPGGEPGPSLGPLGGICAPDPGPACSARKGGPVGPTSAQDRTGPDRLPVPKGAARPSSAVWGNNRICLAGSRRLVARTEGEERGGDPPARAEPPCRPRAPQTVSGRPLCPELSPVTEPGGMSPPPPLSPLGLALRLEAGGPGDGRCRPDGANGQEFAEQELGPKRTGAAPPPACGHTPTPNLRPLFPAPWVPAWLAPIGTTVLTA